MLNVEAINQGMSSMVESIQDLMSAVERLESQDTAALEEKIEKLQESLASTEAWFVSANEELCDVVNSNVDKIKALEEKLENMQVNVTFVDEDEETK